MTRNVNFIIAISLMYFYTGCNRINELKNSVSESQSSKDSITALFEKQEYRSAQILCEEFIEKYPNDYEGWVIQSSILLAMGKDSLSEKHAISGIKLNDTSYVAYLNLGRIYDIRADYDSAKQFYEKALLFNPNFAQTYSHFVGNRLHAGDYIRSVSLGEKAVLLGNKISDKAFLCLSYKKAGMVLKSDSLLEELRILKYQNLLKLEEALKDS